MPIFVEKFADEPPKRFSLFKRRARGRPRLSGSGPFIWLPGLDLEPRALRDSRGDHLQGICGIAARQRALAPTRDRASAARRSTAPLRPPRKRRPAAKQPQGSSLAGNATVLGISIIGAATRP